MDSINVKPANMVWIFVLEDLLGIKATFSLSIILLYCCNRQKKECSRMWCSFDGRVLLNKTVFGNFDANYVYLMPSQERERKNIATLFVACNSAIKYISRLNLIDLPSKRSKFKFKHLKWSKVISMKILNKIFFKYSILNVHCTMLFNVT